MIENSEGIMYGKFVDFNENTGLSVSPLSEIRDDLDTMLKSSFGIDFVIQDGSEMDIFLDLLANSLFHSGSEYKKIYDSLGFINSTGVTLDNSVSLAGIVRTGMVRSSVEITISRMSEVSDKITIESPIIQDSNGNNWSCDETIEINTNEQSVKRWFYATDGNKIEPYNLSITAYNGNGIENGATYWKLVNGIENVHFQNESDSKMGEEKESDAHLKYRYYTALYNPSNSTMDGLKSKLLNINSFDDKFFNTIGAKRLKNPVLSVNIYQNSSNAIDGYNVDPHSIWVIVDGNITKDSDNNTILSEDDKTIAKVIKNFKSMGAGTSFGKSTDNGKITYTDPDDGSVIKFSRAEELNCYIDLEVDYKSSDYKQSIDNAIKKVVSEYVNNLGIGNDVLFTGIASAIYQLYSEKGYEDYVFDIKDIKVGNELNPTDTKLQVDIYQYATITIENINIINPSTPSTSNN